MDFPVRQQMLTKEELTTADALVLLEPNDLRELNIPLGRQKLLQQALASLHTARGTQDAPGTLCKGDSEPPHHQPTPGPLTVGNPALGSLSQIPGDRRLHWDKQVRLSMPCLPPNRLSQATKPRQAPMVTATPRHQSCPCHMLIPALSLP